MTTSARKRLDVRKQARELAAAELRAPFLAPLKLHGLPKPEWEYRFHPDRLWRLDYAFPLSKLAIECEGGVWTSGRHTRGAGFLRDVEKYNELSALGWRLLRTTPDRLTDLSFIALVRRTLLPTDSAP